MTDSKKLEALLARETENALGLATLGAHNASKTAERVVHVVGVTDMSSVSSLRSSAMRLRIMASECLEIALTIGAEAARLELMATLRSGLANEQQPSPSRSRQQPNAPDPAAARSDGGLQTAAKATWPRR
jgi:hypothetical protein